jgi:D-arginine dehydrogenase
VVVVGGGIAGVSAAFEIAAHHDVTLLEREPQLAYHTTGRSAALFTENYGDGTIRPLTAASRRFFDDPPPGFADHPLLRSRPTLTVARADQQASVERLHAEAHARIDRVELIDGPTAQDRCPVLRSGHVAAAVWDPYAADIDVAALHQGFVRGLRARGGRIVAATPLDHAILTGDGWRVETGTGMPLDADVIVNASGAWGDDVAVRCGIAPIGLIPKRRTAFTVDAPADASGWPMVIDADEAFYFKPDGTQLLCSPADATPSGPVDARPEEIDVAIAIERINAATTLELRHVRSQWAGLRTFAVDEAMVIGCDPATPSFVWAVGQGGTGIQSAPAVARIVAAAVGGEAPPADLLAAGLDAAGVDPSRFASGRSKLGPRGARRVSPER